MLDDRPMNWVRQAWAKNWATGILASAVLLFGSLLIWGFTAWIGMAVVPHGPDSNLWVTLIATVPSLYFAVSGLRIAFGLAEIWVRGQGAASLTHLAAKSGAMRLLATALAVAPGLAVLWIWNFVLHLVRNYYLLGSPLSGYPTERQAEFIVLVLAAFTSSAFFSLAGRIFTGRQDREPLQ